MGKGTEFSGIILLKEYTFENSKEREFWNVSFV
jgi:hypothetical protein